MSLRRMRSASLLGLVAGLAWGLCSPSSVEAADPKPKWVDGNVDNCRHGSVSPSKKICDAYYEELRKECRSKRGYFEKYAPGVDQWACYACPEGYKALSRNKCTPVKKAPLPKPKPTPKPETKPKPKPKPKPAPKTPATPKPKPKPPPKKDPPKQVPPKDPAPAEPEADRPEFEADGPFSEGCTIDEGRFWEEWEKYSDIDPAIPVAERSFEAKELFRLAERARELVTERELLLMDIELVLDATELLHEMRSALKRGLQKNLIKATIRLAYVTYGTIKSAKGLAGNYEKVLDSAAGKVDRFKNAIDFVKGLQPGIKYENARREVAGSVAETGVNVLLDVGRAAESFGTGQVGAGLDAAATFVGGAEKLALPSADISPEEVAILRDQNQRLFLLDQALLDSWEDRMMLQYALENVDAELKTLRAEAHEMWKREAERVRNELIADCELQRERHENPEAAG